MKKSLFFIAGLLVAGFVSAADLGMRIMPGYSFLLGSSFNNTFGITGAVDFSPLELRGGRDQLYVSAQASLLPIKATGIEANSNFYDISGNAGYNFSVIDRLTLFLEGGAGVWNFPEVKKTSGAKISEAFSGISFGGTAGAYFNILPELSAGLYGSYKVYSSGSSILMSRADVGLGLKYSFSKGFFPKSNVEFTEQTFDQVFPVFFSRYDDHPFGTMTFTNNESFDITDVQVTVFIEQYMSRPSTCGTFDKIKQGETFTVDATAFLDETVLNYLIATDPEIKINVSYKLLGKAMENETIQKIHTVTRNNMTWEDDRRAAAFVSGRDGSASFFANYIRSIVKSDLKDHIPENKQYAAGLFAALKAYGINYVVDPASSFTDNIGTNQVDFLQFPYQTLLYHGGDCDDLSILNCALFEALGIDSAFVTVPGHIFIAFDSGVSVENAKQAGDCVIQDGTVWIPLEITLCQDTFSLELSYAMREWNKYPEERALIPLRDAWKEYSAVGIPDSSNKLDMPSKAEILKGFREAIK